MARRNLEGHRSVRHFGRRVVHAYQCLTSIMSREIVLGLYVLALAIFVGYEVIARVPAALHTPLMSATNAIHGVVLLGAILVAGAATTTAGHVLGFIALVFGAANVFGGFAVTERMLELFRSEKREKRNG